MYVVGGGREGAGREKESSARLTYPTTHSLRPTYLLTRVFTPSLTNRLPVPKRILQH